VDSRSLLLDPLRSSLRAGAIRRERTSLAHSPGPPQSADLIQWPVNSRRRVTGGWYGRPKSRFWPISPSRPVGVLPGPLRLIAWTLISHPLGAPRTGLLALPIAGWRSRKRKLCDADHRRARRGPLYRRHVVKKGRTRHDLDIGPRGRRALHRPRHDHCAVVYLHSGLRAPLRSNEYTLDA
jgi:hypothetical protein